MATAIVTGGSGGIGSACVRELARDHDVVVHYHTDREGAEAAAGAAEDAGGEAVLHGCDVSDPAAADGLIAAATDAFGGLDVLVNNAGLFLQTALPDQSIADVDRTLGVNLAGTIYLTRAALPALLDGGGHVVNVASTAGTRGSPTDPVYAASKAGMVGLTKSLAKQYTAEGLHSAVVAPGATDTKMYAEERRPAAREAIPIGRLVAPEEVADAVRYFVGAEAVSGKVLEVDGGRYF